MHYNFYPGPSKIYPQVAGYFQEAMELGIMERNHRSDVFHDLYSRTIILLKSKLNIPLDYEIVFVSSATECWEIIAQSFINKKSYHFYNGAFGEKWYKYTKELKSESVGIPFEVDEEPQTDLIDQVPDLIALTHNETSNGTAISESFQKNLREEYPNSLIAFDATSSMAGYELVWEYGDIWYASVQKCFGLPAGLAIMVVSPAAISKAKQIDEAAHYNSFNFMLRNSLKNETHYTPNISNIFLLNKVMQNVENISALYKNLKARRNQFFANLDSSGRLYSLSSFSQYQSDTVLCIKGEKEDIRNLLLKANEELIILGKGYGEWKDNTVRIANFPAIPNQHMEHLVNFINRFIQSS